MRNIPPEIDSLIWHIADKADASAVADFSHRYPAYRADLMKRISTVRALRESNRPRPMAVPAFVYPGKVAPVWPKWSLFGAALVGIGVLAYVATLQLTNAGQEAAAKAGWGRWRTGHHRYLPTDEPMHLRGDWREPSKVAMPAAPIEIPKPTADWKPTTADVAPQSFHVERASLQTVIKTIA